MSYFVIGVGGTGAKFMHSLIHMTAAGLLPDAGRTLNGFIVDSDQNNGSVHACLQVNALYARCKQLQYGSRTHLFKNHVELVGPWTPVEDVEVANLESVFDYTHMRRRSAEEADLMELLFSPQERSMKILEGFRGRPAIGATIFGRSVTFEDRKWKAFRDKAVGAQASSSVPLLLAGSVFGGSGAAGVPTICRLLKNDFEKKIEKLRVGLILFLPYFTYTPVEGEVMQARPEEFLSTTAEALKYYDEGNFLDTCHAIYTVGEQYLTKMPVSSVGKIDQRNPPHFLEMIAGFGAIEFLGGAGQNGDEHTVLIAGRKEENTVRWGDLPTPARQHAELTARLQQMILFAVAYHYIVYPTIESRDTKNPIMDHLEDVPGHDAAQDLAAVDAYVESFLEWLLSISTPDRRGSGAKEFEPGMVDVTVFATPVAAGSAAWRLKRRKVIAGRDRGDGEFLEKQLGKLFRNLETKVQPNISGIFKATNAKVDDPEARGAGKLVRAIYDACKLS